MPQLQRGSIYMEPREERTIGGDIQELTNLITQMKLKEYLLQRQAEIMTPLEKSQTELYQAYAEAIGRGEDLGGLEVGGLNIKGLRLQKPKAAKAPPKLTSKDLEEIATGVSGKIGQETPYLGGFPGVLEKFMPWGGVARRRGMGREFQQQMEPFQQLQREQFQPSSVGAPAISPGVKPGTIVGRFTGGEVAQPAGAQIPPEIAAEYPDAYQGPDGNWYVDKDGKTYRIEIE